MVLLRSASGFLQSIVLWTTDRPKVYSSYLIARLAGPCIRLRTLSLRHLGMAEGCSIVSSKEDLIVDLLSKEQQAQTDINGRLTR